MNTADTSNTIHQDPLGLRDLDPVQPGYDGWPEIRAALETRQVRRGKMRAAAGWMAVAASVLIAILITTQSGPQSPATGPVLETAGMEVSTAGDLATVDSLIALSQSLESRLRTLREETGSMPANSVIYVAELEDLVAQVDGQLSYSPDSINLWGQRVNLLLDLAQIYQHQWEMEYGRMASL